MRLASYSFKKKKKSGVSLQIYKICSILIKSCFAFLIMYFLLPRINYPQKKLIIFFILIQQYFLAVMISGYYLSRLYNGLENMCWRIQIFVVVFIKFYLLHLYIDLIYIRM